MDPKLIQEINRLFDELVHDPWSKMQRSRSLRPLSKPGALVVEIPLKGAEMVSMGVATEGRRVTVVVSTRANRRGASSMKDGSSAVEEHRQTFEVPEGTRPGGFEAHLEGGMLRVRIDLQEQDGR